MTGSKTIATNRKQILDAMQSPPKDGYYQWDGSNEDDKPATAEELHNAVEACRGRGRPSGTELKAHQQL